MEIETPATIPGPDLAALRLGYGIKRSELAKHLNRHRNTLRAWETAHTVDVRRQREYTRGLRELVDEGHRR